MNYLEALKNTANNTFTENGAITKATTGSDCLDLFATIGAIRSNEEKDIIERFFRAYSENADYAMKILFFGRDIREGLGERRVFRVIVRWLADNHADSIRRNIRFFGEYGRFDDLMCLMGTGCEQDAIEFIREQISADCSGLANGGEVSLLAKWLPSVNASSVQTREQARKLAKEMGLSDKDYRRMLTALRKKIGILENNLRERDYSFDYGKQASKAMFKYRRAFFRNDGIRYGAFLESVQKGEAKLHVDTLAPYEIIRPIVSKMGYFLSRSAGSSLDWDMQQAINATWESQENYAGSGNTLVVIDGSGSMYSNDALPACVALSLGIYFAERNTGMFANHFITFSERPKLVEIKGRNIVEKVRYCASFNEVANTDIQKVFELILNTAFENGISSEDMPSRIVIVSDMEFDSCSRNAGITNFEYAKQIFRKRGYELPQLIFWNVCARNRQQPVEMNERGVALVSGCTSKLFKMVAEDIKDSYETMLEIILSDRYSDIIA